MESSSRVNVSNPSASKRATSIASAITRSNSAINELLVSRAAATILIGLALSCAFLPGSSTADEQNAQARTAQLQRRFAEIRSRPDALYAEGALEQAHRALQKASAATEDPTEVGRAQEIATAALALADRQLERRSSQTMLLEAQRRLSAMRERAAAQRRVLEALMRERAALAREGESR